MRKKLSAFSVITTFICLALIGASLIPLLSIQLSPSPASSSISVNFSWSQASAKVIEQEVTSKLEGMLNGVQGVQSISSISNKGSGRVTVEFKKQIDMDAARFEMSNLIRQLYPKLPQGVSYPQLSMSLASQSEATLLSYSINANQSPYFIKKYVDDHLVPQLSVIKGVSQVNTYGAAGYEWVISYDAQKLFQLGLSVQEISSAINTYFSRQELGVAKVEVPEAETLYELSVRLEYKSPEEIQWDQIPIGSSNGRILYLGDVAQTRFQEGQVSSYYRINGKNTINLTISPEQGVNSIRLAASLKEKVKELQIGLDQAYQVELTYDPSAHLEAELQKIKLRSFFSLGILLVLCIVLYRNLKYLVILFSSILINLLVAVIFYHLFQVDLQLYSFAGMTISFGIIIDNTIIMMDHLRKHHNKNAFLAILAATLTTIAAVTIIFLLEESQRANLWDFALVIAINLGVSLLVALYLVPALMEKSRLGLNPTNISYKRTRLQVRFIKLYGRFLSGIRRPSLKWLLLLVFILGFGVPLHLAPSKIEGEGFWAQTYNISLGNDWFNQTLRPELEKYLGGSLRLFTENVFEQSYYAEPARTSLRVSGTMPEGHTIEQLNEVIRIMENYIASFEQVELFETQISSYRNSSINIYFKKDYEMGGFPFRLKSLLETKAVSLGGLDWGISGVGRGFSNALYTGYKSDQILLQGYNYDQLYAYAEDLGSKLEEKANGRVREVEISSGGYNAQLLHEYYLDFDPKRLALQQVEPNLLYGSLRNQLHSGRLASVVNDNELQEVQLVSDRYQEMNVWDLRNDPLTVGQNQYKLGQMATISKSKTGNSIRKQDQQYELTLAFNFIGPRPLAEKFKETEIEQFSELLPIGYKISRPGYNYWDKEDKQQYYYLFVIVAIIFFICAILLESLLQPLAIIFMIPISFTGVFLTFYLFELNFDQGGYASFILLSGISVNAALYIVNDYNNLRKKNPEFQSLKVYLKAYNYKIIPILITIVSTIGGLVPFIWDGQQEVFWFSFAAGSIGGLCFSLVGIFIYLPLFILYEK